MKRWTVLGLVAVFIGSVAVGCATSNRSTSSPPADPTPPTTTANVRPKLGVPAHLVGSGYREYGTLHVSRPAVLRWKVAGMEPSTAFFNVRYWSAGRPGCTSQLAGPAHYMSFVTTDSPTGTVPVPPGVYKCFTVDTSRTPERWTVSLRAR